MVAGHRGRPVPLEMEEGSGSDGAAEGGSMRRCAMGAGARRALAAAFGVVLLGVAALTARAAQTRAGGSPTLRAGGAGLETSQLSEDSGLMDTAAVQLGKELFDAKEQDLFDLGYHGNGGDNAPAREEATSVASAPAEDMHDGNLCDEDEELFAKLCYKKCSLITNGKYPKRTSAWSCCAAGDEGEKCGLFNQKLSLKICSGYDVSGDRAGNGCPHPAGACLENEEVHLGRCFKKCGELTDGAYPTRVAAATCCKAAEEWKCLDPRNVKTRPSFDVGGGMGDGDSRTPRGAHWPKTAWTESKES